MSIIRGARPSDNFVMIQNAALGDERLSYKARGLLAYMLSRPPGWTTSAERLAAMAKDGRDSVRTGLRELEEHGYLTRKRSHDEAGKWSHDQYVTDEPLIKPDTIDGKSVDGKTVDGFPDDGKAVDTTKTESNKTDSNKTDVNNTQEIVLQDIVPVSPALPDWLTYGVADSSRQKLEAQGLVLEDVIDGYLTCGYWTGEPKNQERFVSWVNLAISQHMLGKPMPHKDVIEPGSVDDAFHLFWETYPKKERQPVALAAFKAAIKKVTDPMEIITGAQGYARKCKRDGTEEQYMKSPTNWLIDEQWKDKYPAANSDRSRTAADY